MALPRTPLVCLLCAAALFVLGCSDEPELPEHLREQAQQQAAERQRVIESDSKRAADTGEKSPVAAEDPPNDAEAPETIRDASPPPTPKPPAETIELPRAPDEPAAKSEPPGPQPAVSRRTATQRWDQMRGGLPAQEVRKLLGPPTATATDIYLTYWYYGTGPNAGKVALLGPAGQAMAWVPPLDK